MPVEIEVSDEQLEKPGVGKALANLTMALAGEAVPEAVVVKEPVAAPEPVVAVKEPEAEVAPEPTPAKKPAPAKMPAPPKKKPAPAKMKAEPEKAATPKATWQEYEGQLGERPREFLRMLQSRTRLTISAAAEALGVAEAGVGGLVGALNRRANQAGIELPLSASRSRSGQRMWAWKPKAAEKLGVPAPVAKEEPAAEVEVPKAEEPAPKPNKKPATKRAKAEKSQAAPSPAAEPEKRAEPPAPEKPTITWTEFEAGLSENTRIFLSMLQTRTRLTMSAAQEALGLPKGKAVGGMIGALTQKATKFGFELPFSSVKSRGGQRMWAWLPSVAKKLGIEAVVKEAAPEPEPVEAKVEEPAPAPKKRAPAKKAATKKARRRRPPRRPRPSRRPRSPSLRRRSQPQRSPPPSPSPGSSSSPPCPPTRGGS